MRFNFAAIPSYPGFDFFSTSAPALSSGSFRGFRPAPTVPNRLLHHREHDRGGSVVCHVRDGLRSGCVLAVGFEPAVRRMLPLGLTPKRLERTAYLSFLYQLPVGTCAIQVVSRKRRRFFTKSLLIRGNLFLDNRSVRFRKIVVADSVQEQKTIHMTHRRFRVKFNILAGIAAFDRTHFSR